MRKISWFLSHPIQYFSPLFRELGKKTPLQVFYYSDASVKGYQDQGFGVAVKWDTDLLAGYESHFLKNYTGKTKLNNAFFDVLNPGVLSSIWKQKGNPVIVNGWSYSTDMLVIVFARLIGRKVWLRAENPLNQELRKSKKVLFLKRVFLKNIFFRLFIDKCLYIGTESKKFFEYYGVSGSRLIYTPYSVDNDFFSGKYNELKMQGTEIRKGLGLPLDKKIILFSGKYIQKKRPMDLLKAFQQLDDQFALVMVGEGELRKEMESFIQENGLRNVYLTGFINQSKIPEYYSIADVFVMCSGMGETWGLSVNEAMNFGKPVIISDTCGCSADLVQPGENGFIFPEGDIKMLAVRIKEVLGNEKLRMNSVNKSIEIIQHYSNQRVAENISARLMSA